MHNLLLLLSTCNVCKYIKLKASSTLYNNPTAYRLHSDVMMQSLTLKKLK